MWCWHRIKEQESGLCPACRTPYGDDPHEFSAVDVEEVLKAKKEKEAAERERKRNNHHDGNSLDGEGMPLAGMKGQMDVPRDRSQLANMRVIRRNLVYAVGLPINMATEEVLRKADYFGQYGKISKIVLNRSQATATDPRRASASAYVTFAHKVRTDFEFDGLVKKTFLANANFTLFQILQSCRITGGHSCLHSSGGWILHRRKKYPCFLRNFKVLFCFHQEC